MLIQKIYDMNSIHGFTDGDILNEFFVETVGEPSPSGKKEINDESVYKLVYDELMRMGRAECFSEEAFSRAISCALNFAV